MLIRHGAYRYAAVGLFPSMLLPVTLLLTLPAIGAPVINSQTVSETALDNGLRVIIKPERNWGVVSAGLVIKACPLYETDSEQGLSDLVRHMIHDVPAPGDDLSLSDWIEDRGGRISSYTTPDGTHVRITTSAGFFPEALARTARATFEPSFREEIWANQLQTLRRRLMDVESSPVGKLWRTMWETAFRQHPYGRPVSGTPDGIAAYDAEDLAAYHRNHFVPNNSALIVVGDIDAAAALDLIRELFGKYPRGNIALREPDPEPIQTDTRTRLEKADTRNTLVSFGWHAAGIANKPDVCALDLIYALLIEGQQARLMQAFVSQEEIGAVPEVEFITKRDPGLFLVTCVAKPQMELETREIILAEIEKLHNTLLTPEELAGVKAVVRAGYSFDNSSYENQVSSMGFYEAIDSYRFAIDYITTLESVTAEDVQRVARQYLGLDNYSLVIIRPKSASGPVWEARLTP
ncbi:MAG: insulinase family protein [Armatimonadetes bacterium]|nr:insulinase family protein [Armatimonadota bacterium]